MLIWLAGCQRHPPSHFASWFTYSLPPSPSFHFSTQAIASQLRKSSFDSLWAVLIYSTVIRQYFSQLSSLPPSIHPSRQLTHKLMIYPGWYTEKRWSVGGECASFRAKQCYFVMCPAIRFLIIICVGSEQGAVRVERQFACQQVSALLKMSLSNTTNPFKSWPVVNAKINRADFRLTKWRRGRDATNRTACTLSEAKSCSLDAKD